MYGIDHCAVHEVALDDVTEEFEMLVRSPKPWLPSDAASKKSATKGNFLDVSFSCMLYLCSLHVYLFFAYFETVASSNSQHRNVKESLEYGIRYKAWRRGPWPTLASVDDSESRSAYNNGATSGSASVTSNSFRSRPYSMELQKVRLLYSF